MFHNSRTLFYTCQVMERTNRTPSEKIGPGVLNAAISILDEEGPDGFTVRAIALRADVAPMAIYNHFNGVNGVLEALWIEGFDRLRQAITFDSPEPGEDLRNAGRSYRLFALENRGLYTVMFMHRFRNFEPSLEASQIAAQTYETLVDNVERCQRNELFAQAPARDTAQVIWSACHGYVSLELLGINFAADREATFELLLSALEGSSL
jgi:AcrR family transcriptional regulator